MEDIDFLPCPLSRFLFLFYFIKSIHQLSIEKNCAETVPLFLDNLCRPVNFSTSHRFSLFKMQFSHWPVLSCKSLPQVLLVLDTFTAFVSTCQHFWEVLLPYNSNLLIFAASFLFFLMLETIVHKIKKRKSDSVAMTMSWQHKQIVMIYWTAVNVEFVYRSITLAVNGSEADADRHGSD